MSDGLLRLIYCRGELYLSLFTRWWPHDTLSHTLFECQLVLKTLNESFFKAKTLYVSCITQETKIFFGFFCLLVGELQQLFLVVKSSKVAYFLTDCRKIIGLWPAIMHLLEHQCQECITPSGFCFCAGTTHFLHPGTIPKCYYQTTNMVRKTIRKEQ